MLVNGIWTGAWHPLQASDGKGRFLRQSSSFRNWVTTDGRPGPTGRGGFRAEAGRYHLFVALICPWACRTLMARSLKRLDDFVTVTILEPFLTDEGWRFGDYPGSARDPWHGATHIHEYYTRADPGYTGRATVPILWDTATDTIVNNESADILRMFDEAFDSLAPATPRLYPTELVPQIEALETHLYATLNNGVYRAGFAQSQAAYDEAVADVFATLDDLEARLDNNGPFLFGPALTGADVRLFVTLVRFDLAYHGLFKCSRRRISDYPNLSRYTDCVAALPGVADTISADHIRQGYYSIRALNPTGIVPVEPAQVPGLRS